jgi:hypothetical protein
MRRSHWSWPRSAWWATGQVGLPAGFELGQEIPVELYEAVARVLAVVMSLRATV